MWSTFWQRFRHSIREEWLLGIFGNVFCFRPRALDPPDGHRSGRLWRRHSICFTRGKLDQWLVRSGPPWRRSRTQRRLFRRWIPDPVEPFRIRIRSTWSQHLVIKADKDYSVTLNDDGLPRLKISSYYQRQLHSNVCSSAARDYLQEKMRGAMWLIKSIHQRQRTIYKTTQSILKFQREFFDKGIDYLRPLVLKDVADDIEMHESTVSRVTTNKYIHTPRGIFELKYFFNSGIRHGADAIASESVKNQILKIVKSENPKKPASDKQIVEELARVQIQIARRTVAKYRDILGIPPSSKRRKKF